MKIKYKIGLVLVGLISGFIIGFLLASVGVQHMYLDKYNWLAKRCIEWSILK